MASSEGIAAAGRWAAELAAQDLPVLGATVQRLAQVTSDRESSAADLTQVVLADASMASGVLRLANSALYRPGGREIGTVSRAVVLLGFAVVHGIGLSLAVIDQLLRAGDRERVVALMNQAVLAAVQARALARACGDPAPEEVFIAALLYRLGAMAFWSLAAESAREALAQALEDPELRPEQAERAVLGISLHEVSARLSREWHLGPVLRQSLRPGGSDDHRGTAVRSGHRLEQALRRGGAQSPEYHAALESAARLTGLSEKPLREALNAAMEEVPEVREVLGIPASASLPPPERVQREQQPDPKLQLRILREMSGTVRERRDPGLLLEMGLEGVYRGLAMDRAAVLVLSRDRRHLQLRHCLGDDGSLRGCFPLELADSGAELFREALAGGGGVWRSQTEAGVAPAGCSDDFLLAAIQVRGRPLGLFYADRGSRLPGLDADGLDAFCHFAEQVSLGIEHLLEG